MPKTLSQADGFDRVRAACVKHIYSIHMHNNEPDPNHPYTTSITQISQHNKMLATKRFLIEFNTGRQSLFNKTTAQHTIQYMEMETISKCHYGRAP